MHIELRGEHAFGVQRLAGLALHAAALHLKLPSGLAALPTECRAPRSCAPVLELAGLGKHQPEGWPTEISVPPVLLRFSRFLELLVRNGLATEDDRDRIFVIDGCLVGEH